MQDNSDLNANIGKTVVVKSVEKALGSKFNGEELIAELCYHYPQYDLYTASKLSFRQIKLLLKIARKQQASHYYNLVQIAAAPHTDKGSGVKKLSEHFKKTASS